MSRHRHCTYPGVALDETRNLERRRELIRTGYAEGILEADTIMETQGLDALRGAARRYAIRAQATSDPRLIGRSDGLADVLGWHEGGEDA